MFIHQSAHNSLYFLIWSSICLLFLFHLTFSESLFIVLFFWIILFECLNLCCVFSRQRIAGCHIVSLARSRHSTGHASSQGISTQRFYGSFHVSFRGHSRPEILPGRKGRPAGRMFQHKTAWSHTRITMHRLIDWLIDWINELWLKMINCSRKFRCDWKAFVHYALYPSDWSKRKKRA